jgi:hypothetical protein
MFGYSGYVGVARKIVFLEGTDSLIEDVIAKVQAEIFDNPISAAHLDL